MAYDSQTVLRDTDPSDDTASLESLHDFEKLRGLLVGNQTGTIQELQARLEVLEQRIQNPSQRTTDTSEVLAEAFQQRMQADAKLGAALQPVVVEQFRETSRQDPEIMAEALFPILGPALRKMIVNILSPDKSNRKGAFRVEQLFLIHNATGLPVTHVAAASATAQDADMVSGMLTAIQSFVKDAFDTGEFDGLNTLRLGDVSVWIEDGPEAVLAAVVRGVPPNSLRDALQIFIEDIHLRHGKDLSAYDGDASEFDLLKPEFNLFLEKQDGRLRNRIRSLTPRTRYYLAALSILTLLVLLRLGFGWYDSARWNRHIVLLEDQPGIVVTDQRHKLGEYYVAGLRDPLAVNPTELLKNTSIDPDAVEYQFEPYQAIHPDFVLERAVKALNPPEGVEITIEDAVLRISGATASNWLETAQNYARSLAGVDRVIVMYATQRGNQ